MCVAHVWSCVTHAIFGLCVQRVILLICCAYVSSVNEILHLCVYMYACGVHKVLVCLCFANPVVCFVASVCCVACY